MRIIERMDKETAREYALRMLKYNIISLELAPGSLVSENELAREMGVSRTPIREALIDLGKQKIVEIFPQKGSFISLIDSDLVEEARFLRLTLESAIVEIVCEEATQRDILALEENVRLQLFYLEHGDQERLMSLDNQFHQMLFEISKKRFTYQLLDGIVVHFDRVRNLSLLTIKDSKVISDHQGILEAIKERDKQKGREIITKHLSRYKVDEEELKRQYPDYFYQRDQIT